MYTLHSSVYIRICSLSLSNTKHAQLSRDDSKFPCRKGECDYLQAFPFAEQAIEVEQKANSPSVTCDSHPKPFPTPLFIPPLHTQWLVSKASTGGCSVALLHISVHVPTPPLCPTPPATSECSCKRRQRSKIKP